MKYAPKEGIKAKYQDGSILQVQSVVIISPLEGFHKRQQKEKENRKKRTSEFENILEAETKKQPKEVTYVTSGYSRDAKPVDVLYSKREYS